MREERKEYFSYFGNNHYAFNDPSLIYKIILIDTIYRILNNLDPERECFNVGYGLDVEKLGDSVYYSVIYKKDGHIPLHIFYDQEKDTFNLISINDYCEASLRINLNSTSPDLNLLEYHILRWMISV